MGLSDALAEEGEFRQRSYKAFCKHIYGPVKAQTIVEADEGPHRPVVLRRSDAFDRFASIANIEAPLFAPDYVALRSAVENQCTP
jgi:hypothetical protein